MLFGMAGKRLPADGVVTGAAAVDGRLVHWPARISRCSGGSAGEVHSIKVAETMEQSLKTGSPFVFINDSGGARVQEGIDSLSGYGKVFYTNVMLSGAVPQISLICGPCAGGAAYSPALTDFIIQTRKAQMFITGPQVIKQVTGESVTAEELGGAGCAHGAIGRDPLHRRGRQACDAALPEAAELPAVEQPGRSAASAEGDPNCGSESGAERHRAGGRQEGLRRARRDPASGGLRRFPGSAGRVCAEHRGGLCADRGPHRRHHRQPAVA